MFAGYVEDIEKILLQKGYKCSMVAPSFSPGITPMFV